MQSKLWQTLAAAVVGGLTCVSAMAAPLGIRIQGSLSSSIDLQSGAMTSGLNSMFTALVIVDVANAENRTKQDYPDGSAVDSASSQIGCRGYTLSGCLWDDGPGSPVVLSWAVWSDWGVLTSVPSAIPISSNTGLGWNRQSSEAVPGGAESWSVASQQAAYFLTDDPAAGRPYVEYYGDRALVADVRASGTNRLIGDLDLGVAPDVDRATSTFFSVSNIVGQQRSCQGNTCSEPTYQAGSFSWYGQIAEIAVFNVAEPSSFVLALAGLLLICGAKTTNRGQHASTNAASRRRWPPQMNA